LVPVLPDIQPHFASAQAVQAAPHQRWDTHLVVMGNMNKAKVLKRTYSGTSLNYININLVYYGILNHFFFPSQVLFFHPKVEWPNPKGPAALLVDPSYLCLHQAQQWTL
jgi:hypothetical protein